MAAIKGLVHVIKSAVESEERIPHQLRLETTGTLTLHPDPAP